MQLGLSSFTYGWAVARREPPLDEMGLLDCCARHGLKLLQIGDNLPLHTFELGRLARFADRATAEGVRLEVGTRRLTEERVGHYVSLARALDAKLLRVVIDDTDFHPDIAVIRATLHRVEPMLGGLVLGLENHDRFPARVLRELVEEMDSERVGICLDTANSLGAGEGLETVLNELAHLAVNLHVKDFAVARVPHLMGFTVEGRPAGAGQLDIPALRRRLVTNSRCRTAVLELWTPPEPTTMETIDKEARWAEESIRFLRPMFG